MYAGSQRVAKVADGEVTYHVNDHLGSARVILDEAQKPVWSSDYRPFGRAISEVSKGQEETKAFTGKELDSKTGLYYYGARYYAPATGRLISVDPRREFASPYVYCANNPLTIIDP